MYTPAAFVARQFEGVVGFEIPIERIEGKWKLSQNRSADDRAGVARGVESRAGAEASEVLAWMRADRKD